MVRITCQHAIVFVTLAPSKCLARTCAANTYEVVIWVYFGRRGLEKKGRWPTSLIVEQGKHGHNARATGCQSRGSACESLAVVLHLARCSRLLGCVNAHLARDRNGYLCTNSLRVVPEA